MCELHRDDNYQWTGDRVDCESGIDWAIMEQANGIMALIVNSPGGILTGKQMGALAEIVGEDGVIKNTLQEAYVDVRSICDDCASDEHDAYCTVNVVLTALGILLEGKDYVTSKDKELLEK